MLSREFFAKYNQIDSEEQGYKYFGFLIKEDGNGEYFHTLINLTENEFVKYEPWTPQIHFGVFFAHTTIREGNSIPNLKAV
jgi:hypothetical protein